MSKKLDNLVLKISEKYGDHVVASDIENEKVIVSTGSIAMDTATGVGGFMLGKMVEIFAEPGVGKSTTSLHVIAEAQKMGLKCSLLDSEHAYDKKYAQTIGVNTKDLIRLNPSLLEDAANMAVELIKSEEVQVIIIDSLSALTTNKENEGDIGDANMGVKARLVGQFCRKVKGLLDRHNVLLVIVGQLRDTLSMYGPPKTTDYGKAISFFADVRIELSKKNLKEGDEIVGNTVTAKFIKNKLGKPYQACEYVITFGVGIDNIGDIFVKAKELLPKDIYYLRAGVVKYNGEKYSQEDFQQLVRDNEDFKKEFQDLINKHSK